MCKAEWTGKNFVGERAAPSTSKQTSRRSGDGSNAISSRLNPDEIDDDLGG